MLKKSVIPVVLFLLLCLSANAQQQTVINGRVTEAESATGIAFANIYFKGTMVGAVTDFEGYYSIKTTLPKDSVVVWLRRDSRLPDGLSDSGR